ncbi:MAG: OprO/OprP family phosphate-selective porin [Bacteroidales bacterium]|nr:OprO/OprP family phosphate-selective porin [Bacteroidales bacterium]
MKLRITLLTTLLIMSACLAMGQIKIATESGDLNITFKARTHFDAGVYGGDLGKSNDHATNVVRMNDTRIGFIANYGEAWSSKVEVKFTGSSTTFTDLYFGYKASDKSSLQLGNFWMPFGYETLGPAYRFIQNSSIDKAVDGISRKLGLAYNYNSDPLKITVGIFSDGNVNNISTNQGYNIAAKVIARPILNDKQVLHFGVAPLFTHTPNTATFNTYSLTQSNSMVLMGKSFTGDEQYSIFRAEAEAIFISGKLYAECRYQHAHINTPGDENSEVGGFYVQGGFLLIGDQQNYSKANGYATNVSAKNLELCARFGHAAYDQGKDWQTTENDITIGLNYGINKYLLARLNYTHGQSHAKDEIIDKALENHNYNAVEARLQFVF